jgi:hypothetical protein
VFVDRITFAAYSTNFIAKPAKLCSLRQSVLHQSTLSNKTFAAPLSINRHFSTESPTASSNAPQQQQQQQQQNTSNDSAGYTFGKKLFSAVLGVVVFGGIFHRANHFAFWPTISKFSCSRRCLLQQVETNGCAGRRQSTTTISRPQCRQLLMTSGFFCVCFNNVLVFCRNL